MPSRPRQLSGIFASSCSPGAYTDLGRETEAEALVESVLAAERVQANRSELIAPLLVRARLATRRGRWAEAEAALEGALGYCRMMAYRYPEVKALHACGLLDIARGQPERARERFTTALAICAQLGEGLYRPHIEQALAQLGVAIDAGEGGETS